MKRQLGLLEMVRRRTARASRRATRGALGCWVWSNAGDLRSPKRWGRETRAGRGRRGSTLLVVIALLGMLMLLGMLYFTFASQEMQNATNFAEAAKKNAEVSDDIEAIFDESIRQLILGGDYSQKNSVLWGGRHSMLGTLLGQRTATGEWPRQPYTGRGVSLLSGFTSPNNFSPNDSPAANDDPQTGAPLYERDLSVFPGAGIDHTYPDFNNMLLAYQGNTWDPSTTPPTRFPLPVVKPSFHRPELLRDFSVSPPVPLTNWAVATNTSAPNSTKGLLFRAHPEHLYAWRQSTTAPPQRRYIVGAASNPWGDSTLGGFVGADAGLIGGGPGQVSAAFPFLKDQDSDGNYGEQGVWSRTGSTPVNQFDAYDYDVDTDGDSIPDANWMDLDLPTFTRPSDGRTYIPMIAFKVLDLDGLLNLNSVGNLSGDPATRFTATTSFGNIVNPTDPDISRSSMGLSPSEINPIGALDAVPGLDFTPPSAPNAYYARYFAHDPLSGNLWHQAREAGNMEWWWLNKGRVDYLAPNVIHPGRLGEANRLWQVLAAGANAISANSNLFPFSGVWDQDDNRDFNEGGQLLVAGLAAGQGLSFKHPLALNGLGKFWTNPKQLDLFAAVGGNPSQWLRYTNAGVGDDGSGNPNVGWVTPFGGALMRVGAASNLAPMVGATFALPGGTPTLIDDMNELSLEPNYDPRPYDEPFTPKDTLLLFMNQADRTSTGIGSRILDLMPGNIDVGATGVTQYLPEIGKRFTTTSWDLKQFALNSNPNGPRAWEWNLDTNGNNKPEFPPQFSGAGAFQPTDPFRPQLRLLLETEFGNTSNAKQPMRLSVNEYLDVESTPGASVPTPGTAQYVQYVRAHPLAFRPLTPHSTNSMVANIPPANVVPQPPYPPAIFTATSPATSYTAEEVKEYWARRERQQMARDIYVMLYTFCGGDYSNNVTNRAGDLVYPDPALPSLGMRQQMAQFAVNMVDALDRDNVITAFEYDASLFNGWDLDDDATTLDGPMGTAHPDRRVVYGVEAQQLTISEALWCYQPMYGMDHNRTPFVESATNDFNFLFVELRSTNPTAVPLASTATSSANTGVWRIRRDDNFNTGGNPKDQGNPFGTVEGNENAVTFLLPAGSVNPGDLFTIATSDPVAAVGTSDLYIDHDVSGTSFELIAPNSGGAAYSGSPMTPQAKLDLTHTPHATRFVLTNGTSGDFLSRTIKPTGSTTSLVLERRLNPDLPQLSPTLNPWITVDVFEGGPGAAQRLQRRDLNLDPLTITTQVLIDTQLANATSIERGQPLDYQANGSSSGTGLAYQPNTLTQDNSNPIAFNLFQPIFDRDFASTMDLLHVSMAGPDALTQKVGFSRSSPFTMSDPASFGQAVIHNLEDRNNDETLSGAEDLNGNGANDSFNHFHRLLSMVEVPTRTHRHLGDPLKFNRVPGRINLNTVRDPRVLGALIDDRQVIGQPEHTGADFNGNGVINDGLLDLTGDAARDWWFEFLNARDGLDLTSNLFLPGVVRRNVTTGFLEPVSHPFRDVGNLQSTITGQSPIEDTILRQLQGSASKRRLLDVASEADHDGTNPTVEPILRQRLLSKIYGNSTTRSNCFVVFVTIGMFECIDTSASVGATEPVVRIGGPLYLPAPAPAMTHEQHRAVFIIDRSDAEQSFDPGGTNFDWQKLVTARQRVN